MAYPFFKGLGSDWIYMRGKSAEGRKNFYPHNVFRLALPQQRRRKAGMKRNQGRANRPASRCK